MPPKKKSPTRSTVKKKAIKPKKNPNRVEAGIKSSIESWLKERDVYTTYDTWYCGITNNVGRRKIEHMAERNTWALYMCEWKAVSMAMASRIEDHFHHKGMLNEKGKRGAKRNSVWVYVFKDKASIVDAIAYAFGWVR